MTDYKVTGLTSLTDPESDDVLLIVDVHDTSTPPAGPGGSDKKITVADLTALGGDLSGTAANATVAKIQGTVISAPSGGTASFLNATGAWTVPAGGGAGGTGVTTVSVATANGFAGTVATATTTPVVTIETTVTGLLKGNGTAVTAATAGTDYLTAPVTVPEGGTGGTAMTAYAVLAGGTAATSALQQVSGLGSSGQVLTSNGVSALPTWQPSSSGFANPMTTLGDLIYENATPAAARLAGGTTSTKNFLVQAGTGSVSAAPAWGTIQAADVPQLTDYAPAGLTGATAASRYAGATTSGAPASGTFDVGDFTIDQTAAIWICTTAGTVGSGAVFTEVSGGGGGGVSSVAAADSSITVTGSAAVTVGSVPAQLAQRMLCA